MDRPQSSGKFTNEYIEDDTGQIKDSVSSSVFASRGYNVYLPNGQTKTASYPRPAILLLHGAGRTGVSLVERWRAVADQNDVILLGPHANGRWNPSADAQYFIPALLKDAIKKYNIDPGRIYLFGHSMGGVFAATLTLTQPDGFAAIGIHAGSLPKAAYPLLEAGGRKTPIIIINGTRDQSFPLEKVKATANAFSDADFDVDFYILQNHGHWYYDIAPSINDMVWNFFKDKSL